MSEPGKHIIKYSDESMFKAEKTEGREPRVTVIHANNDPLGQLAQLAMMYQGKSIRSLSEITDEDRHYYFQDGRKNILGMPSEAIVFHFLIENVTRSYTHQLVRTRQASYAQESLRFAVKEDFPVAIPPSLRDTKGTTLGEAMDDPYWNYDMLSDLEKQRLAWDDAVDFAEKTYLRLINMGMPAEDARGLLPHNVLTKVNMVINLRSLMNMAGQRLCTQAQFEHRQVWAAMLKAIREYGREVTYTRYGVMSNGETSDQTLEVVSDWQFDLIADQFLPICYQTGKCQFQSDFDRYCNIRDRVQANAEINRPPSEWHRDYYVPRRSVISLNPPTMPPSASEIMGDLKIRRIHPQEWLHPNAAIHPDPTWRSEEAQRNIKDRRL